MKILFAFLLVITILPAFAEPLSDKTGLKNDFTIEAGEKSFVVETVSNFDVRNVSFENNTLVFELNSSLENNFGEIQIPNEITQGRLRFFLDGQPIEPKVMHNERISFITLEFAGNGSHTLNVNSDFVANSDEQQESDEAAENKIEQDHSNDSLIIFASVGIVVAGGAATTAAVYFKRKKA
ncbi:MAG: hypothetical protein QXN55_05915 [Candidatus Nitrosotenuis sp.]